jgi:small subunit ribosomal protein S1
VLDLPRGADQDTLSTQKAKMRGDKILVKVLEVEPRRERLVLSERAAKKEQRQRRLSQLDAGEHLTGTVTNIVDFGAFVDLDGVNGLIHLSELSWHWVDHPSDVLEVGQEVEVLVKKVSEERGRISLSRKALLPSPWDDVEARHSVSDLVSGEVTSLADFGAFVALKDGIEGLIHISELGIVGSLTPDSVVQPGETVLARIIEIDAERQRMSLSLNQVTYDEQMNWMAERQSEQELEYEPLEEDLIPAASQLELDDDAQEVPVGDDPQGTDEQRADLT